MNAAQPGCRGCQEYGRAALSRRSLLKGLLAGAAAVPVVGVLGAEVAYADPADTTWNGDTLVVLSLRGGFDGLSAVVPIHNDLYPDYLAARPSIAVPQNQLIDLDGRFGMHPALAALEPWHAAGRFGAVVAAGLPSPNRSHFEAMEEIEKAAPGSVARSGWLNRVMGRHHGALRPLTALQIGSNDMPVSLLGNEFPLGMDSLESFVLDGADSDPGAMFTPARWTAALTALSSGASATVRASTTATLGALADVAAVQQTAAGAGYPDGPTGAALRDAARLIKSDKRVKLITLDVGNWDMHTDLGRFDRGWMRDNLTDLGDSLAAFAADLGPLLDDVTLVTISEFGRRVQENESGGLDHGWGNAMLVLGGHVDPGVKGDWRGLTKATMVNGDVHATTDYRAVLCEILAERCDAGPEDIAAVFPGYGADSSAYPGIVSG